MLRPSRRNLLRGSAALAATKLFTPSIIKPASAGYVLGKASGGGGGGYVAGAITLAVNNEIEREVFSCTDSPLVSGYQWFKGDLQSVTSGIVSLLFDAAGGGCGIGFNYAIPSQASQLTFADPTFTDTLWARSDLSFTNNAWNLAAWAVNCTAMTAIMVVNGATATIDYSNTGNPFVPSINGNEVGFYTPGNNTLIPVDFSDTLAWIGQEIDWSNPINLATIYSVGKPVDTATSISAFGEPSVKFYGNAANWTSLAAAQGFDIIAPLINASSSPSD